MKMFHHTRFQTAEDIVQWRNNFPGYEVEAILRCGEGYIVFWWSK